MKHKSILETARSASIDAAYAELLKPSPLEIALQALPDKLHEPIQAMMAANNLDELLQQIQQHLVLLTPEAATAIEQLIDNLRQADQENIVQAIEERYEILKQAVLANRPIDEDLAQLLVNWINADTWEESQEMLAANAEQLLSNDAIETLTKLLVLDTREDKEEEEKRARTILQHLAILELALAESIYAAYAELLEPSPLALALEALPGDLREALQAMMAVNSPAELLEQIQQHPVLLTEQAIGAIDNLLNDLRQVDQEDVVAHIEARYETLKQVIEVEYSPLNVALKALPEELCAAIQAMIEVKSSTELLEQISQHPILLTEQATGAIDKLLNDLRQADQEDVVDHIEARYEILKQVIGEERDPHRAVLNALLNANTPGKLQQTIAEYPMLLDDESLNALSERINQVEQGGNTITAERLRFRLGEVHRIQQQRKQAAHTGDTNTPGRDYDAPGQTVISSEKNSIAIGGGNSGNINQTNIESYTLPVKHWQPPKRQSLPKTFVGRQKELQELREYLLAGEGVAISGRGATMLQGMGGIGKTYLAIQLSVELQGHFPGGVIRIDLGPLVTNAERAQVQLRRLATYAFGGNQPEIVGQLQPEQVAAWLQETSPGRLLVIFDDVWEQEPLLFLEQALPADAVRIVTTRDANIAQALGGKRISLDRLSAEDGLALLKDRLGCQGNAAYRTVLEKLVELLGGHALALDIAASLIKTPRRIQAILGDLQQGIGLGTLDGLRLPRGETRDTNLEKSLALSYERMLPEEQSRFRALGVFAAETPISAEAAAAIWNMDDLNTAQKALFELTDLSLLDEFEDAMGIIYRQHSLLHTYAYALLDKAGELNSASWAHAEYYRAMALRAETTTPRDYPLLDRHMQNLLAALLWTDKHESVLFSQLVEVLFQFLQLRGQSELLEVYLPKAAAAASATGNIGREANLLKSLGDLESRLGNLDQARSHYDAALPLFQAERDRLGEANLLKSLGDLESRLGNLDQARAHYDAALPLFQVERDRLGEANVYMSLGYMFLAQEERTQAKTHYERALPLYIAERDPLGQANILIELGRLRFESGNHEQGMKDVQQAAMLFHSIQSEEWAQRAEQYLSAMRAQLEHREANSEPSLTGEGQLLEAFINVESSQAMFELVQQNPQLLTGEWFTTIEELIAVQTDEPAKRHISERLDALKQIKHGVEQQVSASSEVMRVLLDFSVADWAKRRQLLDEHSALLLNEQVEQP